MRRGVFPAALKKRKGEIGGAFAQPISPFEPTLYVR